MTGYNSRSWLRGFFRNPNAVRYYGNTHFREMPESVMGEEDLSYLIDFLLAQSEPETAVDPILREIGETILEQEGCYNCHTYKGKGGKFAPTLDGFASDEWLRGMIEDAGQEKYFGRYNTMPSFKEEIGRDEMDKLILFIQSLRSESDLVLPE
ncbi:MAG: cytochrome c [Candidatus Scalindua sp.]|nr:cytochrome c [Candidatus Scalindua sp.]